ncbi:MULTISPECIES: thioredoxin family protein [unclassified Hahella]|uniref:thioredoxin family protein n=1 Tax=unclassified Hahella TaxID=2624107 RepID=UPI000FDF024C|nr:MULTISPECIES: thioredoxin family protein [unclassified Hahella]AZZ90261.1 thioredoxin family protein [Hahella sp. KA22]MBU6955345.1 thioredoxin family protein [Hahella sp. HN01]MDG9668955.1 thioredoxin family protein [Hahella sp. CR1]QAY53631.1 DUF255 domain-containing protein [Hahella sp. KA22]
MHTLIRNCVCLLLGLLAFTAAAGPLPYDESADARRDIQAARSAASEDHKLILLTFGANWCPDCRVFDEAMQDAEIAALVSKHFKVVKVDIGDWDKNLDIVETYGNPIEKGIPSIVVTDNDDKVLFATRGGQLATARSMGKDKFIEFFEFLATLKQ